MQKKLFSVIISNKNAKKWLNKCFTSLKNQTYKNVEVIFIDNASTDDSVGFVKHRFPWVRIIVNKKDLGPGLAMNKAAKSARGKFLFFMNTDSYLDDDALEKLASILQQYPNYELVELSMKNYERTNMKDKPYKFGMDIFGYPMPSDKIFYADVCGAAILKSLFDKIGGFDDKFYMYLDDLDLSWRVRMLGKDIQLLENVYIYHHTGGTSIPTSSLYHQKNTYTTTLSRRLHAQKNNIRTLLKNYSLPNLMWSLPISVMLASAEGFLYLIKGDVQGFFALHKAIWWNIINFPDTLKKRKKVQSQRVVGDSDILKYCEKKVAKVHSLLSHGIPATI